MNLFLVKGIRLNKLFIVLAFFCFYATSCVASPAEHSPRFLVHLLDYLAKDYGGAVSQGRVISKTEYHEQLAFSHFCIQVNKQLVETRQTPSLQLKLVKLNQLIVQKSAETEVSKLAREIQAEVIQVAQLELAPATWPRLERGQELFAQNCVACHGKTGRGDGPDGAKLDPKPANFLDDHMLKISPFQAFNTLRFGVPGTGMPAFYSLPDQEAWALAFYLVSLRYPKSTQPEPSSTLFSTQRLAQAAILSDHNLAKQLGSEGDPKPWLRVAEIRSHSNPKSVVKNSLYLAYRLLNEVLVDYQKKQFDSSLAKSLKAYLDGVEPVEPRLKASDSAVAIQLEIKMAAVQQAIKNRVPFATLQLKVAQAKDQIDLAQKTLKEKEMSALVAFLSAGVIMLREGFEAVLVIIALLGVIRASKSKRAALWVHAGWLTALGLGLVIWFLAGWLMGASGAGRETLEGSTSLFAVFVLLLVGFWLNSQTEIGRWMKFIHGKVQKALDGKNLWALAGISFVAVFRETFETVLFLKAIWLGGTNEAKFAMTLGVISALVLVIFMAWLILRFSAKLPIRRLFQVSSMIMVALALILTGKGLHSFQATGALSATHLPGFFRSDLFGIFPTWETTGSQLLVLGLALVLWIYARRPSAKPSR